MPRRTTLPNEPPHELDALLTYLTTLSMTTSASDLKSTVTGSVAGLATSFQNLSLNHRTILASAPQVQFHPSDPLGLHHQPSPTSDSPSRVARAKELYDSLRGMAVVGRGLLGRKEAEEHFTASEIFAEGERVGREEEEGMDRSARARKFWQWDEDSTDGEGESEGEGIVVWRGDDDEDEGEWEEIGDGDGEVEKGVKKEYERDGKRSDEDDGFIEQCLSGGSVGPEGDLLHTKEGPEMSLSKPLPANGKELRGREDMDKMPKKGVEIKELQRQCEEQSKKSNKKNAEVVQPLEDDTDDELYAPPAPLADIYTPSSDIADTMDEIRRQNSRTFSSTAQTSATEATRSLNQACDRCYGEKTYCILRSECCTRDGLAWGSNDKDCLKAPKASQQRQTPASATSSSPPANEKASLSSFPLSKSAKQAPPPPPQRRRHRDTGSETLDFYISTMSVPEPKTPTNSPEQGHATLGGLSALERLRTKPAARGGVERYDSSNWMGA